MAENKVIKDFFETMYHEEQNYQEICYKIKGGMSMKKKLGNIAAVFVMAVMLGIVTHTIYAKIAWNIEYKEYENRTVITKNLAIEEVKEGESEAIDMDYMVQDEIGIKIESLMLTNDYAEIKLDMKLPQIPETIYCGYAVYDENNNIYTFIERYSTSSKHKNYWKKLKQELGIKSNKVNILSDTISFDTSSIEMNSTEGFPQSKKLYIRIFNIGYEKECPDGTREDVCLSDSEWQFEIEVPEKFYERTTTQLSLSQEVEGITLTKAELTETGLTIKANIKELRNFLMSGKDMNKDEFSKLRDAVLYISDEEGNIYPSIDMGTTENKDEIRAKFSVGKKDLDKKIYLNVSLNEIQVKVELVEK